MSDSIEEEISLAKQHLEKALARARNRDSLQEDAKRWINPPIYDVVEGAVKVRPKGRRRPAPRPRVNFRAWLSLEQVPVGVVVKDKDGDFWKIKADGRLRVRWGAGSKKKWHKANIAGYRLSSWDHFGPFTEVKK